MTFFLHRYTGALSKSLLAPIGLILLAGQLSWQPCSPRWTGSATNTTSSTVTTTATNATTATNLSRQPVQDPQNTPDPHCHHGIFLLPDKRYDLKPIFFLPLPPLRLAVVSAEHLTTTSSFSSGLAAGAVRPACLRGPPSI